MQLVKCANCKLVPELFVHCLLESVDQFDLPLREALFDHHQQSRRIRSREACREQIGTWTQADQAHVAIWKLKKSKQHKKGEIFTQRL